MLEAVSESMCFICWWVELVSEMENVSGSEEEFHSVTGQCCVQVCCRNDLSCMCRMENVCS